jgi:hypothetical protein
VVPVKEHTTQCCTRVKETGQKATTQTRNFLLHVRHVDP